VAASNRPSSPRAEQTAAAKERVNSERPGANTSLPPLGKTKTDWTMGLIVASVLLAAVLFQSMRPSDHREVAKAPVAAVPADETDHEQAAPQGTSEPSAPAADTATEAEPAQAAIEPAELEAEAAANLELQEETARPAQEQAPEQAPATQDQEEAPEQAPTEPATGTAQAPQAEAKEAPAPAADVAATTAPQQGAASAGGTSEYIISVITRPGGSRVTLRGQELYAPGDFTFSDFPEPVRIEAEKIGFHPTAATIDPKDFEADGNVMRRRIYLKLNPEE